MSDLLDQVFTGSRFAQPPWVRGVYFTSGTQEGTPIDRVMGSLARSFGLERAMLPPQKSSGRSYFLTSLLRDVVFPEQRLAGADVKLERRRNTLRLAGVAAMTLVTLGLLAAWGWSTWQNMNYLKAVEARVEPARQTLAALPSRVSNLVEVAPVLQALRNIWKAPENREGDEPLSMTLGLYQGDKLDAAAMLAHQRALNEAFLPQLAKRIEDQLRTAQKDNLEFSYEALKTYLMLHQPERFDADALKAWITLDWARSLDRGIPEDQRKLLEDQLDVLIAQGPPRSPLKMDENLVRNVRAVLASYPLEQRVFSRLKRQRLGRDIPPFSVATAAGPAGPLVFERISGRPLADGVPGMFTYDGYHKRFQNEVTVLTGLLANEDPWVLGQERGAADRLRDAAALGALTDRVRRLYLEEYVKVWEALLADVRLVRANGLEKNIETARILSGTGSPLAAFLRAVVKETTLTPAEQGKDAVSKATETVRNTRRNLENLFGNEPDKQLPVGKRIESIVDDRFEPLRRLVTAPAPNGPAPIDDALKLFNEVYVYLTAVDTAVKSRSSPPPGDVAGKLKSDAGRLPEPVRTMVENLSQAGATQARVAERGSLSQDLRPVTEFCTRAIAGRYPFVAEQQARRAARGLRPDVRPRRPDGRVLPEAAGRAGRHQHAALALQAGGGAGRDHGAGHRAVRARRAHQGHLLPRRRPHARDAAGLQAGRDGRRHHAVHPRRRRPAREVRARPGGADGGAVARPQGQQPGARAGQPAVDQRQLGHGGRRALGAVPRARRRPARSRRRAREVLHHLPDRCPQDALRGHDQQRAASDPLARAARVRMSGGLVICRSDAASNMAPGWFGKLPGMGDFAHRRLPEPFRSAWDRWLQQRPGAAARAPRRLDRALPAGAAVVLRARRGRDRRRRAGSAC